MTTLELVTRLRELLDDESEPYGWTTSYLVQALNAAEEQATRRAYLLMDRSTASVCTISLVASQAEYSLHSRILQIRRAWLASAEYPLTQVTREEIDTSPAWWSTEGTPEMFVTETMNEIVFVPTPVSAATVTLQVARLPLVEQTATSSSTPEIPAQYHRDLLIWGQREAYLKNDADTRNMEMAERLEAEFTAKFGPLPSASDERKRKAWPMKMSARPREFGT